MQPSREAHPGPDRCTGRRAVGGWSHLWEGHQSALHTAERGGRHSEHVTRVTQHAGSFLTLQACHPRGPDPLTPGSTYHRLSRVGKFHFYVLQVFQDWLIVFLATERRKEGSGERQKTTHLFPLSHCFISA